VTATVEKSDEIRTLHLISPETLTHCSAVVYWTRQGEITCSEDNNGLDTYHEQTIVIAVDVKTRELDGDNLIDAADDKQSADVISSR